MAAGCSRIVFQTPGARKVSLTYKEPAAAVATAVDASSASSKACEFEEVTGDLFASPPQASLAHCVSADLRMGAGIAVAFKATFGGVADLQRQKATPGGLAVLRRNKRYVYYLVTKTRHFDKPTYKTLRRSLVCMRTHCQSHAVKHLCMPVIGCGLDGLIWEKVSSLIQEVFAGSNIKITIYHWGG